MKLLIIGQAPARGNDDKPPFSGRSGARIALLMGVGNTGDVLPIYFDLINLIPNYPGRKGAKGDCFDMATARRAAEDLKKELRGQPRRRILLMGKNVRRAMGVNGNWEYLEWFPLLKHEAAVFPHPSGINKWWNSKANVEAARQFLSWAI